jgi:DNA mismatch repair protein MutS2
MSANLLLTTFESTPPESIYEQVDWAIITQRVSGYAHFSEVKDKITRGVFCQSQAKIVKQYQILDYLIGQIIEGEFSNNYSTLFQIPSDSNLKQKIRLIKKQGVLEIEDIRSIYCLIQAFDDLTPYIDQITGKKTSDIFERREFNKHFVKPFRVIVDSSNHLCLENHPEIKALTKTLESLDSKIRSKLTELTRSSDYEGRLQFDGHDIIGDSFVLAVRSDSYNHKLGKVRGRSETGHTLYVEPYEISRLSGERIETLARIDAIVERICREFCKVLFSNINLLFYAIERLHEVDEFQAKANFSLTYSGSTPQISTESFALKKFSHPLISGAIKNDLEVSLKSGLILSGPNTGGKTATLKTLLLSVLFTHFGVQVPAKESEIPYITSVYYQGNDQQQLSQGLSSFSSEVESYLNIYQDLSQITPEDKALIVIDEMFNSTSSEEASSLAISLIDKFKEKYQVFFVISSHHQMFKSLMHSNENYVSAHVGVDLQTNSPTYKLHIGTPGPSMAITIFDRLVKNSDLESDVAQRANHILDKKELNYEALLQKLSEKENDLEKKLSDVDRLEKELKNQRDANEGVLKLKMQDELAGFKKSLSKKVDKADEILREMRKDESLNKRKVQKTVQKINDLNVSSEQGLINRFARPEPEVNEKNKAYEKLYSKTPTNIQIGNKYFSVQLGKIVTVKTLTQRKKQATVSAGSIAIQTPISSLREIPSNKRPSNKVTVTMTKSQPTSSCVQDCRGMRLDDFILLIDKAIYDLLKSDIPFLEVIHGHGDGILKNWLRKYLKRYEDLNWEPSDDDGVTRITAKA